MTRNDSAHAVWKMGGLLLVTGLLASLAIHYVPAQTSFDPKDLSGLAVRILLILLAVAGWYATQYLIGRKAAADLARRTEAGAFLADHDYLLKIAGPISHFLQQQPRWADRLLLASSAIIDQLGTFLLLSSVFGPSLRPLLGLVILFALRQICQGLTALPPPPGMIWRNPGFPSIFVTYGVANDLFFSGHTALAVYGAIELTYLGNDWLTVVAVVIVIFEIAAVLVLRAHYTMDVFAGMITALFVAGIATNIAPVCDRALLHFFS